jgi:uncharacterized protein with PIN domain
VVTTARHPKPDVLRILLAEHPTLARLYEHHLAADDLLDFRPELAAARALADHYLQTANLKQGAVVMRAMAALESVVRVAERVLSLEQKRGPVTRAEFEAFRHAFTRTLIQFVPAEQRAAAEAFCRSEYARHRAAELPADDSSSVVLQ